MARPTKSILDYFPGTPRDVQRELLLQLEANWEKAEVFAVVAPVGSGKSRIAATVAKWATAKRARDNRAAIVTPSRLLAKQYQTELPSLPGLHAMAAYKCEGGAEDISCEERRGMCGEFCGGCPYMRDVKKAHVMPYLVVNPFTLLSHKLRGIRTLVVDEAHTLVGVLRGMAGKRVWRHEHPFPSWVTNFGTLRRWLSEYHGTARSKTLRELQAQLEGEAPERWLVQRGVEEWRGQERECLSLVPVDISREADRFFGNAEKIVLLSGTLSEHELTDLRLKGKRVIKLESGSAIPAERRPIMFEPIGTASFGLRKAFIWHLARWLLESAPAGKGFVHLPYAWAEELQEQLPISELFATLDRQIMFHSPADKQQVLAEWRQAKGEPILIASGMEEGVDLKGLEFSWQAIAKCTWPSLEDPAVQHLSETRGDWYSWQAVRHMVQASGRISRGPDDYGATLILDAQFERLYGQHKDLFPLSFQEAVVP